MKRITIEYDIDYEKYLKNLFPENVYEKIAEEILDEVNVKHIIYSQIGHDEENHGRIFHVADRYKIYDVDTKENIWCDDERLCFGMRRLMWACQEHYTSRKEKILLEKGISWNVKTEEID